MTHLTGHDVSVYQSVQHFPGDFIIARATEGTDYTDPHFSGHIATAENHGQLVGAYHFAETGSGTAQAKHFAKTIGDRELLTVLDLESRAALPHNNPVKFAHDFLTYMKEHTGHEQVIYMSLSVFRQYQTHWDILKQARVHLWLAQYNSTRSDTPGWPPLLWQYSDGTPKYGGQGIDTDVFYGDKSHWLSIAGHAVKAQPSKPAPKPQPPKSKTYRIQEGDTLGQIATRYHTTVARLIAINHIKNANVIYAGKVIHV